MRLVAYDPFVSADRARQMGVELLAARPGRRRVRLPHDPPAEDARRRPGSSTATCCSRPSRRCASSTSPAAASSTRATWPSAIRDGVIAGAALDVFATEPTTESPLFELDCGRRHAAPRGVAPARRRTRPATRSPTWSQLALAGEFVPFAVNVNAAEANETLRPFLPLAERLGRLFASLVGRAARGARDLHRGRHRRLRHAHPRARGAEGLLRGDQRRAGHLRQRPAAGQGARRRGARGQLRHVGRLRQPDHDPRRRPLDQRHARRDAQRAAHREHRRAHRSTCRRPITCWWSRTTTVRA